jgi:hypothetical protein
MKKMMLGILITLGLATIAMTAQAADLTIVNNTNKDSTSIINSGMCSSYLPGGVTKAGETNTVPASIIRSACKKHETDCNADVYMSNNCSGNKIATVNFDITVGVKKISMLSKDYHISGSAFKIQIDPA